jgi:hypothetical protein
MRSWLRLLVGLGKEPDPTVGLASTRAFPRVLVEVFSAMISSRVIVLIGSSLFLTRKSRVAFTCIMIESRFNLHVND